MRLSPPFPNKRGRKEHQQGDGASSEKKTSLVAGLFSKSDQGFRTIILLTRGTPSKTTRRRGRGGDLRKEVEAVDVS